MDLSKKSNLSEPASPCIDAMFPHVFRQLFRNKLINVKSKPLFFRDWVSCGLVRVKDICYEAVPGFLPVKAVHEVLMDHDSCRDRTFNQTARELREVLGGIPAK